MNYDELTLWWVEGVTTWLWRVGDVTSWLAAVDASNAVPLSVDVN